MTDARELLQKFTHHRKGCKVEWINYGHPEEECACDCGLLEFEARITAHLATEKDTVTVPSGCDHPQQTIRMTGCKVTYRRCQLCDADLLDAANKG